MRRVDFQVDGLTVDTLVATGDPGGLVFDFALDIREVCEFSARDVDELCPL